MKRHLVALDIEPASDEDLLRVHSREHLVRMIAQSAHPRGGDMGDGESPFGPGGVDIAWLAAGGTIAAVRAVLDDRVDNAYALVRPPGHHATPDRGMGFCMFANIAVAITHARAHYPIRRVAVVDWDAHFGNGTYACFADNPEVLTISLHQDRVFPVGGGLVEQRGQGRGFGSAINIPLPAGTGGGGYLHAFDSVVLPALHRFKPELIVVACGFDASNSDPLGRMTLTSQDYAAMTRKLMQAAAALCGHRLVLSHEGGYSPYYVPYCGLAVIETLSGVKGSIADPFLAGWPDLPSRELTPAQAEFVARAAPLAAEVPAPL